MFLEKSNTFHEAANVLQVLLVASPIHSIQFEIWSCTSTWETLQLLQNHHVFKLPRNYLHSWVPSTYQYKCMQVAWNSLIGSQSSCGSAERTSAVLHWVVVCLLSSLLDELRDPCLAIYTVCIPYAFDFRKYRMCSRSKQRCRGQI